MRVPTAGKWVAFALLLLAFTAIGALTYRLRARSLEVQLVHDANAVLGAAGTRALHVDQAEPGLFGEALTKYLPALEKSWRAHLADEHGQEKLQAVVAGEKPLSELPEADRQLPTQLREDLDGVLRATHAERAELVPEAVNFGPTPGGSWGSCQFAALVTGLRVRQELAEQHTSEALRDCLDGYALARDAAISGGLIGHVIGGVIIRKLQAACETTLLSLPASSLPDALTRLRRIRDALPPPETTLRQEAVEVQLRLFGGHLPAELRRNLLPRPRHIAEQRGSVGIFPSALVETSLERLLWKDIHAVYEELVAAAALRGPARDAAFDEVARETEKRWANATGTLPSAKGFQKYAHQMEAGVQMLDLVVASVATRQYRLERGGWPDSLRSLVEAGLITPAEAGRLEGIRWNALPDGVELVLPLSHAPSAPIVEARGRVPEK